MRTLRSADNRTVLVTHVDRGDGTGEHGVQGPMVVRPEEVAAIRSGHSDECFITMRSGREYELAADLFELEAAMFGKTAGLAERWDGCRG